MSTKEINELMQEWQKDYKNDKAKRAVLQKLVKTKPEILLFYMWRLYTQRSTLIRILFKIGGERITHYENKLKKYIKKGHSSKAELLKFKTWMRRIFEMKKELSS